MAGITPNDWINLAKATKHWMNEIGAKHDYKEHTRGYITRSDWVDRFKMEYDLIEDDWTTCAQRMFQLGYTIGFEIGKGFFLCRPSDSATYITRLINYTVTMMGTINMMIAAMEVGGKWEEIAPGMAGRSRISDVRQLSQAMDNMGVVVDEKVKQALEDAQRLLTERAESFK